MSDKLQRSADADNTVASRSDVDEWHIHDLLSVIYRRRWVSITTFIVLAAVVVAYTLTATPIYEARAQLLVGERPNIVTFQGAPDSQGDQRGYLETQYRLLRSRSLARRVIEKLKLWDAADPAQKATADPAASVGLLHHVRNWMGTNRATPGASKAPSPAGAGTPKETAAESAVIDRVLSNLRVTPVRDTRIIDLAYQSPDPQLAAQVLNTLASMYVSQNQDTRTHVSKETSEWLASRLAEQRRKVEVSELALQKYRERENSVALEAGQNIVVQRLTALNSVVTQAKTDLITVEALYRQLAASQNNQEALDSFPPIRNNNAVQGLRGQLANLQRERMQLSGALGAKHPEMVRLDTAISGAERELTLEVAKTVESVRQDYLAALSRERDLTAALDKQKSSALALNRQGIEYGVLLREVESDRQIYQSLLQRANEVAVSSELTGSDVEIVDVAEVPRLPLMTNTTTNLLVGLLVSGIMAIAMAFACEVLDSRVRTAGQIKELLGLPFLGTLPNVSKRTLRGKKLVLSSGTPAVYAEACRALRTNVLAAAGGKGHQSLVITSAAPGDGKSVVAVNLAVALGRSGKRVLLVDADLRRPTLHELLECRQRPGLAEVLTGSRKPSEAIASTHCSGVWLLPSGTGLSNPSEQLGSTRFNEFLERLGESFDWVIIDTPPVMAVTDPAVIARVANGVLFVVNARRTHQRVAQAAVDRLEAAGATFAGAVLNGVSMDRDHYYNARYYLPYYGEYLSDKSNKRSA